MYPANTPLHVRKIRQLGQGMSEYLIIVALIAVAAIGVVGFMGDTVSNQMASMAKEISGKDSSPTTTNALISDKSTENNAGIHKAISKYSSEN